MSDQFHYQARGSACAERITLPFGNYRWSGQAGDFSGGGAGASMDFQDHKDYSPGDDPRHINWQAYARSGTYILKQFREEVRPSVDLIIDASPSMFFHPEKKRTTCELIYMIHSMAIRNGAALRTHLISGSTYRQLSLEHIQSTKWSQVLERAITEEDIQAPDFAKLALQPSSVRVLISDLLFEGDPSHFLNHLHARQGKPTLLVPFLKSEENPDWSGNYDFVDAEMGSKHPHKIDMVTLKNYRKTYAAHFSLWTESLRKHQAHMARVSSDIPLFQALSQEAIPKQIFSLTHQ